MGRYRLVKRFVILSSAILCLIVCLAWYNSLFLQKDDSVLQLSKEDNIKTDAISELEWESDLKKLLKFYEDANEPDIFHTTDLSNLITKTEETLAEQTIQSITPKTTSRNKKVHYVHKLTPVRRKARTKKPSTSMPGVLNVHIWEAWCGSRVEDLRRNKHFPLYPTVVLNLTRFFTQWYETGYGERVFGYLHPPETGNYTFAISCDDNCEVWLSNTSQPTNLIKIASVGTLIRPANTKVADFKQYKSQISKQIFLKEGEKYYVEALHKQAAYKDHMLLTWLAPSWPRIRSITSDYISSYISMTDNISDINDYASYIPETQASYPTHFRNAHNAMYQFNRTKYKFGSTDIRDHFHSINLVDEKYFENILPSIVYKPSYRVNLTLKRYEGVGLIHESAVYPDDNTELTHMYRYEDCLMKRQHDSHLNPLYGTSKLGKVRANARSWLDQPGLREKYKFLLSKYKKSKKDFEVYNDEKEKAKDKIKYVDELVNDNAVKEPVNEAAFVVDEPVHKQRKLLYVNENFMIFSNNDKYNNNKKPKLKKDNISLIDKSFNERKVENIDSNNSRNNNNIQFTSVLQEQPPAGIYTGYNRGHRRKYEQRKIFYEGRVPNPITKKVYFRNGVSPNVNITNNYEMIRLYDIFGPAIYYLSQADERGFLWMYKAVPLSSCKSNGNLLLSKDVTVSVVNKYMKAVRQKHKKKYSLKRIVNVEENHDIIHGDRYLIELDLNVEGEEESQRLSRYVYQELVSNQLYEPIGFQWNVHATVHIIVPVKNQGRWVQHFIDNMESIYTETADQHLNVIIVDFSSTDIDIKKSLNNSKLKRYQLIRLEGPFQRALGIQAGADTVKNPVDVLFTCDLHLEIPSQLIDSIRKHTIAGLMAFAPMVHRLSCGYTPELPYGLWEIEGYGLFAIAKDDFNRIGGMNTKEFKTKWGGEDWEFLDRVLAHGLEVERMRIPNFYHYYHSKKRMWLTPTSTPTPFAYY